VDRKYIHFSSLEVLMAQSRHSAFVRRFDIEFPTIPRAVHWWAIHCKKTNSYFNNTGTVTRIAPHADLWFNIKEACQKLTMGQCIVFLISIIIVVNTFWKEKNKLSSFHPSSSMEGQTHLTLGKKRRKK